MSSELVEALENDALPYRTVTRWWGNFSKDVYQPVMSNVRDDRSVEWIGFKLVQVSDTLNRIGRYVWQAAAKKLSEP
ncbi:hypothetical protein TNCV_3300951 [Trichonephila clavipes]|nr:hypothetical protein TNCV_3300951 [Trichonephila clavipes]